MHEPGVDGDGDDVGDGPAVREGDGAVVGAVVGAVLPVHATPLTAKFVGTGLLLVHDPLKPNDTVALVATDPL
ncbi:hypothetical protein GCM10009661_14540 [Catellatospora chokoriensis]